ncbi:MAG: site-specific DNA-methyltransferase [Planctomycetota bacterium]|nr:site-specific DNA-methyltransferase [Planctomycetota bacterium]
MDWGLMVPEKAGNRGAQRHLPRTQGPEFQFRNKVILGDASTQLKKFPSQSVDCVVTSPPYFQQRDYGVESQIGSEKCPAEYVANLKKIFEELKRVLKPTGTVWLNLGDKYKQGNQTGMPWRVAIQLMDDGWRLRNEIIWHKPNAMPSPVKNRLTVDHETIFFFVRNAKYFYDADAIREPHVTFSETSKMKGGRKHFGTRGGTPESGKNRGKSNLHDGRWDQAFHPKGRNKRTVWSIPLSKNRDAHFAVFPKKMVETCVQAGCPAKGIVLDPFCGTGTTLVVAQELGRDFVGIDCSKEYCSISRANLKENQVP